MLDNRVDLLCAIRNANDLHPSLAIMIKVGPFAAGIETASFLINPYRLIRLHPIFIRSDMDIGGGNNVGGRAKVLIEIFLFNGGKETLRSYRILSLTDFPKEHIAFLQSARLWWRHEQLVFVHAGIEQGIPLEMQDPLSGFFQDLGKLQCFYSVQNNKVLNYDLQTSTAVMKIIGKRKSRMLIRNIYALFLLSNVVFVSHRSPQHEEFLVSHAVPVDYPPI